MVKSSPSNIANEINLSKVQQTYPITYSQTDIDTILTQESLEKIVNEAYTSSIEKPQLLHWFFARKNHTNGGVQYRMTLNPILHGGG